MERLEAYEFNGVKPTTEKQSSMETEKTTKTESTGKDRVADLPSSVQQATDNRASKENDGRASKETEKARPSKTSKSGPDFGALCRAFAEHSPKPMRFSSSGSVVLDEMMGGGTPSGKTIEIAGEPGAGKTHIVKGMCEALLEEDPEGHAMFLDVERGTTNPTEAGAQVSDLLAGTLRNEAGRRFTLLCPDTFENTDELLLGKFDDKGKMVTPGFLSDPKLRIVVIDSLTRLAPRMLLNMPLEDVMKFKGLQAQYESMFLKKYCTLCGQLGITLVLVAQMRTKLNFRGTTTKEGAGGFAAKHNADIRFLMRVTEKVKNSEGQVVGGEIEVVSVKNKIAGNVAGRIVVEYGKGVNNIAAYADRLACCGAMWGKGGWFYLKLDGWAKEQAAQGRAALEQLIKDNINEVAMTLAAKGQKLTREMSRDEVVAFNDEA